MPLEKEIAHYNKRLTALIGENEGKYIVINGEDEIGIFDTYSDALQVAYAKLGPSAEFLVRQIHRQEIVAFITRRVMPVCTA